MSTDMTWQTISTVSEDTEKIGEALGRNLKGGMVVELVSDLGGGKTTFTRGLVRGLGITDTVASPTFTISKVYKKTGLEVHHFDFYRLEQPGIIAAELAEVVDDPTCIVVVEWGDIVQDVLPKDHITIHLTQQPDGTRLVSIAVPEAQAFLLEGLKGLA